MLAWWESLDALERGFAFVAFPATALLLIQMVLTLIGLGHDADADLDLTIDIDGDGVPDIPDISAADAASIGDHDAGVGAGLQLFSLRGIIALFSVGGWVGLAFLRSGTDRGLAVLLAVAAGALAMVLTALILKSFLRLQYNGTLDVRNAVGLSGTVYLTIPPARSETGKVTLLLQERLTQIDAVTDCETPIKTGAEVVVVGVSGKTTLIVQPKG
ncbi:MAG: hypothetical protein MRZ67_10475 [Christensenella sp.]|jgi:hypothetical protein|nr:hypothetical protein [Christensenella sp.]